MVKSHNFVFLVVPILILIIIFIIFDVFHHPHLHFFVFFIIFVATLALGSWPRQRGCKVAGQEEGSPGVKAKALQGCGLRGSQGVTSHTPLECKKVWGSVREWTLTLPRQLPLWEMESWWTPETSKSDLRGQNSTACDVFYIIRKVWSVHVQNGLTWAIWTFATQVMGKRRAESQTGSLTPDH